ncbi:hypothetical protein CLOM_g8383 [Closterium sp. NIES-68]|nr:hypothetical protein CLOM_g8383 [Closterium sp. NIES-68]
MMRLMREAAISRNGWIGGGREKGREAGEEGSAAVGNRGRGFGGRDDIGGRVGKGKYRYRGESEGEEEEVEARGRFRSSKEYDSNEDDEEGGGRRRHRFKEREEEDERQEGRRLQKEGRRDDGHGDTDNGDNGRGHKRGFSLRKESMDDGGMGERGGARGEERKRRGRSKEMRGREWEEDGDGAADVDPSPPAHPLSVFEGAHGGGEMGGSGGKYEKKRKLKRSRKDENGGGGLRIYAGGCDNDDGGYGDGNTGDENDRWPLEHGN